MKRKTLVNFSKRIMAGCLAIAMILTGIVVMSKEVRAAETPATEVFYDDGTVEPKAYNIKDYWTDVENTRKAPVEPGFVFGGWYVEVDGKDVPIKEEELVNGGIEVYAERAYAKFVPVEVLSIKTQKGIEKVETAEEGTAKEIVSLRILSTVDSTNYQEVGFEYKLAANDIGTTENITKVYSAIRPYKGAPDNQSYNPGQKFVMNVSKYFIAADVSKIGSGSVAKIVYARPFWITMDGTKVMGLARNSRVEDKDEDKDYTSVGINLLPQLTTENKLAAVAAGKIQVTYNHADYEVVGTPDITKHDTNGGTYLFPEMNCNVNEETGTITFVGNAVIRNGSLTDLTADGLFANIRFVKKAGASDSATLDFAINKSASDFCDWAEKDVEAVVVQ